MKKLTVFLSIMLTIPIFFSCNKEDETVVREKIAGQVQKGPFVNGTSINIMELTSSLQQTGKVFSSQIVNNTGTFEILNLNLSSSYVQLSANGFYFNENEGSVSMAQLQLTGLADITDLSSVNVNILTHLERRRVEYLVQSGLDFNAAKRKAQGEVLAIFGFNSTSISNSEMLDITVNGDGNAILLAVSIILQGKRSVGELTELLANITDDIFQDGVVNDPELLPKLRQHTLALSLEDIRVILENRYDELGIEATIPNFEKFIEDFILFSAQKPRGVTQEAKNVTSTTAILYGYINPGSLETTVTFEYGTSTNYGNIAQGNPSQINGEKSVLITALVESLVPAAEYHYRIVAENSLGRFEGVDKVFKTKGQVIDTEGNAYQTLVIGTQEWMIENLKTTKYNDNELIPDLPTLVASPLEIDFYETPFYCWYNNDESKYKETYGALYSWVAVNTGKLCPAGWHVPTDAEWTILTDFLGGEEVAGGKLKEAGNEHWNDPNFANNESGFNALPGGLPHVDNNESYNWFNYLGGMGNYWTSTLGEPEDDTGIIYSAYARYMVNYQSACYRRSGGRDDAFSVRCIKD